MASISVQGFSITMYEPELEPTVLNPTPTYDQWADASAGDRKTRSTLRQLKSQLDALRVPTKVQAAVLEQLVDSGMVTATFVNTEAAS